MKNVSDKSSKENQNTHFMINTFFPKIVWFMGKYKKNIVQPGSRPVRGLEWPTGFQEVKVPRFHDNSTGWW